MPEDLDGEDLGVRRFFANRRGDRGSVTQTADVLVDERAVLENTESARDTAHVRMRCMNAAVDDGNPDAVAGVLRQEHAHANSCENAPPLARSSIGAPSSTIPLPPRTRTRSAAAASASRCVISSVVRPRMICW